MELNDEQKKRVDEFVKEYGELVKKHKVDFIAFPMFVPDEVGGWKITIQTQPVDTSSVPVKSPFIKQN